MWMEGFSNVFHAQVHFEQAGLFFRHLLDRPLELLLHNIEFHEVVGLRVHPESIELVEEVAIKLMELLDSRVALEPGPQEIVEVRLGVTVFEKPPGHMCNVDPDDSEGVPISRVLRVAQ